MKLKLRDWMAKNGLTNNEELLEECEEAMSTGKCPALCDEGCEVEPDGECEHGGESIMLACGLI